MQVQEIGSCQCILESIKTRTDGSFNITICVNPDNQQVLQNLVKCYSDNEKLLQVAFVKVDE